jgi:hypothetical protein
MSGPPKDVAPNELLQMLLQRPRPSEVVSFPPFDKPDKPGKIRIQVLTKDQHDRARLVAHKQLKASAHKYGITSLDSKDMLSEAVQGVLQDLAACEVLAMACRTVQPMPGQGEDDPLVHYAAIFADGEQVGKTLTADEVAVLFSAYNIVQHKCGPHEAICGDDDVSLWVRRLVEGAADNPFLRLSSAQWAELLTTFAGRLYKLAGILASQWETLPESLRSDLQTYCLDTSSSGQPVESPYVSQLADAGELSMEEAMRFAALQLRSQQNEE